MIAAIVGFGLGAILAASRTKLSSHTFPSRTVVEIVHGQRPIVTETVPGPTRTVSVPGPTVTKTVPGPTRTVTTAIAGLAKSAISDGTWQVGTDVTPGTYHAPGGSTCGWVIESGSPNGSNNSIVSKGESGQTNPVVTLSYGDRFTTTNCGTWH
jgi:hypothetical protein